MSDKQTAKTTASGSSGGATADLDVDHSPEAARKASRAGLLKASQADRAELRDNSKQSNIEGYQAVIMTMAKQILDRATQIETFSRGPMTEAGREPLRQAIEEGAQLVNARVAELEVNLSSMSHGGMDAKALGHPLSVFGRAYTHFSNVVAGAGHVVIDRKTGISPETVLRLKSIFGTAGLTLEGATSTKFVQKDDMGDLQHASAASLQTSAVGAMLQAAGESVRLARASIASVGNDVRLHDLKRAEANLRELAAQVVATDDKTRHGQRAQLRAVARDARSMFAEQRARPLELDRDQTRSEAQQKDYVHMVAPGNSAESSVAKIEQAAT